VHAKTAGLVLAMIGRTVAPSPNSLAQSSIARISAILASVNSRSYPPL